MQSMPAAGVPDRPPVHDESASGAGGRRSAGVAGLMDTRGKIVDLERAAEIAADLRRRGARVRLALSHFDVLTPSLVRRFAGLENGEPLLAAVLDPAAPLLAARARAELAAGLCMIDYVFPLAAADFDRAMAQIQP